MFNGMTVGFVGSLICGPLLGWGSRILVLKAFVQGGLQTDWLDSGQLLFKPSLAFPIPFRTVFNLCLDHAFPSMKRTVNMHLLEHHGWTCAIMNACRLWADGGTEHTTISISRTGQMSMANCPRALNY